MFSLTNIFCKYDFLFFYFDGYNTPQKSWDRDMFTTVHLSFYLHFLIIWELRILIVGVLLLKCLPNLDWYKTAAQKSVVIIA